MNIQLNDKVKFLDEEGGGVVTRIIDHAMVEVTTPDGFSFPYQIKDLVKPNDDSNASRLFSKEMSDYDSIQKTTKVNQTLTLNETPLQLDKGELKTEHFAAYLAFIPRDQYKLVFGNMDVFLVNAGNFAFHYVLFAENDNGYKIISESKISPFSRVYLAEITRDDLNQWENIIVQMIVLQDGLSELKGPVDTKLRIRGNKFFSESSYIQTDFLRERAVIYEIVKINSIPVLHAIDKLSEKGQETKIETKEAIKKKNGLIYDHQVAKNKAVVDIHIWKLTDDELSLSNHQKLLTQMDYFIKCIDSAIENHFEKVIFIHGVGTGRLKEEIQTYLDDRNIPHKPAPMSEYGIGAIQVTIPVNYKG